MSDTPNTTKPGSEKLGPDGQPVPAMGPRDKDMHGGAGSPGAQGATGVAQPSRPPARPGDTPADTTLTADSDTGPMISERPMPARSDRQ
jgi:hypothetical protein